MARIWLLPAVAVAALAGAASFAQAAPASPALGFVKAAASEQAGTATQVNYRGIAITMSGKFLPFKYYGSEQGIQEYGVKES